MASLRRCFNSAISVTKSFYRSQVLRSECFYNFSAVRHYGQAYEGEGKTHAVLLNNEGFTLMINSYSEVGFGLNNGITVLGPIAIFPNVVLSWNVGDMSHINEEALSLFLKLEPKLDILILGVSEFNKENRKAVTALTNLVRKHKIQVEVLSTEMACPTFNFMVAEQRFVGAGILPPLNIEGEDSQAVNYGRRVGYVKPSDK